MKKLEFDTKVTILEAEKMVAGAEMWMMLEIVDDGVPLYDIFRGVLEVRVEGDAESGPISYLERGVWENVASGMGKTRLEDEVARFHTDVMAN